MSPRAIGELPGTPAASCSRNQRIRSGADANRAYRHSDEVRSM
jgi:hypothetical protein